MILLVGLEGMRYDEAAEMVGVPIGAFRSRLSCGRDWLRRLMDLAEHERPSASRRRRTIARLRKGAALLDSVSNQRACHFTEGEFGCPSQWPI